MSLFNVGKSIASSVEGKLILFSQSNNVYAHFYGNGYALEMYIGTGDIPTLRVPPPLTLQYLTNLQDIVFKYKEDTLILTSNDITVKLSCWHNEVFTFPKGEKIDYSEELIEHIFNASQCMFSDQSRFNVVFLDTTNVVGTDGRLLYVAPHQSKLSENLSIPLSTIKYLKGINLPLSSVFYCKTGEESSSLLLQGDMWKLLSPLTVDKIPNYQDIKLGKSNAVIVNKQHLINLIKKLIFKSAELAKLVCNVRDNTLFLTYQIESNVATAKLDCSSESNFTFSMNPNYFLNMLSLIPDETITIQCDDSKIQIQTAVNKLVLCQVKE